MTSERTFSGFAWSIRALYSAALIVGALAAEGAEAHRAYHLGSEPVPLWQVPAWLFGIGVTPAQHAGIIATSILMTVFLVVAAHLVVWFDYGFGVPFGRAEPFVRWVVRQANWYPNFPTARPYERMGNDAIRSHDERLARRQGRRRRGR